MLESFGTGGGRQSLPIPQGRAPDSMKNTSKKLALTATLKATYIAALVSTASAACALGLGQPPSQVVLGEALNMPIQVRLEPGEDLPDSCVSVDVYFGENKLPGGAVHVRIEPSGPLGREGRVIRIATTRRVDEPFVSIYLAAGCTSTVSRKFVAFADPPASPLVEESGQAAASASPAPREAAAPTRRSSSGQARGTARGEGSRDSSTAPAAPRAPRAQAPRAVAAAPAAALDTTLGSDKSAPARAPAAAAETRQPGSPRLMLDPIEADTSVVPGLRMSAHLAEAPLDAASGTADAASAAERREAAAILWRALNASPEEMARDRLRLQELEGRLAKLRSETATAQENVKLLQARVQEAESQDGGALVYVLAGLSAALAAALGAVLWKRRDAKGTAWWQGEATVAGPQQPTPSPAAPASPVRPAATPAFAAPDARVAPVAPVASKVEPVAPRVEPTVPTPLPTIPNLPAAPAVAAAPVPAASRTKPVVPVASRVDDAAREVSVEELIDLEQQAEFFLVLGQDQAAVDLLASHIEGAAGSSPLPYLKLLELHQRRNERDDYEAVRERFNERFNAYAPSWESDLQQGHSLAEYPGVIERLQALWATPVQAMDVLQASLLRRDPQAETFDLPAYRELLFLYSVARDLSERENNQGPVDLLLPFSDESGRTAEVEPLMATRPVKPHPMVQQPLTVDVSLDLPDTVPAATPDPMPEPHTPAGPGPIDFEPVDVRGKDDANR